jgi:ATP-dependent protease ClpP protease subunit
MRPKRLVNQRSRVLDKIRAQDPALADKLVNLKLDWFRLKNQANEDSADLYIYDEIMPAYMAEWFGGVSAEGLIEQLSEISASTINVRINSPGGSVFEAIAIYNTLVSHSATINVYVDAIAASAASIIAMAGDKVTMMVGAQMMIHDAIGIEMGNAADLREMATFLDKQSDNLASIYAARAGGDIAEWRSLMLAETWMFAQEAVDLGLADEIYSAPEPPAEPEEGSPEEEQQETPEEEQQEEEQEQQEGTEPPATGNDDLEDLMGRRHALVNRGFKYNGRRRAPDPEAVSDGEIDNLVSAWSNFGRK